MRFDLSCLNSTGANHSAMQICQSSLNVVLIGSSFAEQLLQAREFRCQTGSCNMPAKGRRSGAIFHRSREQACARPPAQIPACALTHGAPASDDDERPLVRPRVLKPVAETRETPTQNRHRKCVLHCLIGSAEWSIPPTTWVLIPRGLHRLGYPDPLGRRHSERKTPFRVSLRSFSYPVGLRDTLSVD